MRIEHGKLKLDKRDVRVGNFVYSIEPDHIRVQDISRTITHRISRHIVKGQMLQILLKEPEKHEKALRDYATLMYNLLCVLPDAEFYKEMYEAGLRCVNRHKDIYGIKEDITDAEDAKIVQEEKELHEAMEEIKSVVGEESESMETAKE